MHQAVNQTVEELRNSLPVLFALSEIDNLTGCALRRRTLQNLRAKKEIPPEVFLYDGKRKTLVRRDPLLDWYAPRLKAAKSVEGR
jgi:hypothetical protein